MKKDIDFGSLLDIVKESGYSRLPVYEEEVDKILGILYVKDLIGHTQQGPDFDWNSLIRTNMLYIPENKKIDDLLRDFSDQTTAHGHRCGRVWRYPWHRYP
ncbi:MAG: CBS domain-containing protein [Saprospiraceae bacterium]|nr:CBS domain-containing protein [Saprospiraceae bacterium]